MSEENRYFKYMTRGEKLQAIAAERNIDMATKKGLIELISIVVDYEEDIHGFLEDTLMMLDVSTDKAYEDIAKDDQ